MAGKTMLFSEAGSLLHKVLLGRRVDRALPYREAVRCRVRGAGSVGSKCRARESGLDGGRQELVRVDTREPAHVESIQGCGLEEIQ